MMRNSLKTLTPLLTLTLSLSFAAGAQAMPNMAPAAPTKASAPAPSAAIISGKVAETFKSGGYTYVAVEQNSVRTWVASPPVEVVVGQQVAFQPGMVMRNFTSQSLNRTFDAIVFSGGLATPPAVAK